MVAPAFFASMTSNLEKTALITGASSGIGYELAKLFARDGYRLVLVARDRSKLETQAAEFRKLGSPQVWTVAKDLAEIEAPFEIFDITQRAGAKVDVLVNNAGFGARGAFAKSDLDTELDMMQVNLVALTHLTKLYLPQMVAKRNGRILNVASTAAFQPGPFMAVYYASKAFVLSFSEAIAEELKGTGVTVTCLCPGATATAFAERASLSDSLLFKRGTAKAADVAREGYAGVMKGKRLVVTGTRNRFMAKLVRFVPKSWVLRSVRGLQE